MTLYEIDQAIENAFDSAVDPETGEIINIDAYHAINDLQMERNQKIENVSLWVKNLVAENEAVSNEIKNLQGRKKSTENKIESLKNYLMYALNGEKFKTPRVVIGFRRSKSVNFTGDVDELPDELVNITRKENKTAIKKAIESGVDVPGAEIVQNTSIQIK